MDGEAGHTQRREANALAPHGTTRNVRTPHTGATGTSHAKAGATAGASCAEAGSSSKLHEMNPRKHRAASHKAGACASRMCCAGTPRPASPLTSPATPKRNTQEWQDSRVVHDSRGLCSEKTPSWQDLRAVYSRKAICRAFRIHGARILPKSAHFGCMAAICCQEGALFPSEAPFGIHEAQNLPRIAARERTRAKYCHCKALGNASEHNLAIARHPGTHQDEILPSPGTRERTVASRSRETPPERSVG